MKNIILCSDGTGNAGGKGYGTNVWRLFTALDLNNPAFAQVAYHDDGVGSRDNPIVKAVGGAFGLGLRRNLRQLYQFLVDNYEPGDQIYIFGFSRGAYTARALAGLIANCGIVDRNKYRDDGKLKDLAKEAIGIRRKAFVRGVSKQLSRKVVEHAGAAAKQKAAAFRAEHCVRVEGDTLVRIRFVGVWDTVDAYGLPFDHLADFIHYCIYPFRFPDAKLSPQVDNARHAISIDDERHSFHPVLWDEKGEKPDRIKQVWFSGVHSNVGGGYPKQGLTLVSLDWMMEGAEQAGLKFIPDVREAIRASANPYDKLSNSRAGLALYYRYKPRDVAKIAKDCSIDTPCVHTSVLRRIQAGTEGYAPLNLPSDFRVAVTGGLNSALPAKVRTALAGIARRKDRAPLLRQVFGAATLRRLAHYGLLGITLAVAVLAYLVRNTPTDEPSSNFASAAAVAVPQLSPSMIGFVMKPFQVYPALVYVVAAVLLLSWAVSFAAKSRMRRHSQRFWRQLR
jgi:uncharacterized protein (DUF2235 family)